MIYPLEHDAQSSQKETEMDTNEIRSKYNMKANQKSTVTPADDELLSMKKVRISKTSSNNSRE